MLIELCELAKKYGCDKDPSIYHNYTPFYAELFKDRPIKRLLEIGIFKGASLKMWRDYFPHAEIFGIDIDANCLFNEERIHTYQCDASNREAMIALLEGMDGPFDIIIDDGSHIPSHQILAAELMPNFLSDGGIFIIEDVLHVNEVSSKIVEPHEVKTFEPNPPDDTLIIIRR